MNLKYDICVIGGCGHVGLPLSIAFAASGMNVAAYDINTSVVERVNKGEMPFLESGAAEVLKKVIEEGRFRAFSHPGCLKQVPVVISVVGTPVDEHLNPKLDLMTTIFADYIDYLEDGQLLILRSTVFPGASASLQRWLHDNEKNIDVAFCPERIAEGKAMEELRALPQIISAFTDSALKRARALFEKLTPLVIELSPIEAELTKLFNNAWRYIRFAAANQFFMIANNYDVDFDRIHWAMTYEYPRAKDFPRAGYAAGPCLFKDTMQLSAVSANTFFLGHSAMLVNEGLPNYVVERLKRRFTLRDLKVGILGMAFKAEVDDKRDSLSYKLRDLLAVDAKEVLCSDPYIQDRRFVNVQEILSNADVIIIGTPHNEYKSLDFGGKPILDVWNITGRGLLM